MKFEARIDTWIKLYFGAVLLYLSFLGIVFIMEGLYTLIILQLIICPILLDVWFRTNYQFKTDYVKLRSGIFVIKVKYDDIESINYRKGIMRGFALSSKQLVIKIKGKGNILGKYYIAPKDREGFIQEMKKHSEFTKNKIT